VIPFADTRFSKKSLKPAFLSNNRPLKMFNNAIVQSNKIIFQNLIDIVLNIGLITLVGASIVAALAMGTGPISTGDTQTAMPALEWQSIFDQRVVRAPCYEPQMQRLVSTVSAPIGQGWG
jgi:hypothetical protein